MHGHPASSLPSEHCDTPSHLLESGRHFSQSSHVKNPSLQAQTGVGVVVPTMLFGVVTTEDPVVVVVPTTVVDGPGIIVVDVPGTTAVVSTGAQKQHPSESVSIFIPAAHWLRLQYGAQCN